MLYRIYSWFKSRTFFFKASVIGLCALILFFVSQNISDGDEVGPLRNNVVVFSLVYLNAIFISLLSFLIGRNVIKLIFDRRNNILGSKLRTRLVVAFAGMAIVTNIFLFVFAGGLLNNALTKFFSVQFEDAVTGAVDVARIHYSSIKERSFTTSLRIVKKLANIDFKNKELLLQTIENTRETENLFAINIVDEKFKIIAKAENAAALVDSFKEPILDNKAIERAFTGKSEILSEEKDAQSFIRGYFKINNKNFVVVTTLRISPEVAEAIGRVNDTFREYKQTKIFKDPLRSGYLLTLSLITGVILFAAIWFGFYLARQITEPIQVLAEATNRVAKGDYETFIGGIGDDEFGYLAQSFNIMTSELRDTRDEVLRRGEFIETILARLGVAVVALNLSREIIQMNESSEKLFLDGKKIILPQKLESFFQSELLSKITPLIKVIEDEDRAGGQTVIRESEIALSIQGEERKFVCTVAALNDSNGERLGCIVLFDDITEITKAQSMAIWREVARRIAHEIKNPLTPIKLSSQRLTKLVKSGASTEVITECAESIVQNVDSIAKLANEFSSFARMPTVELKETALNAICREVLTSYRLSHTEILFYDEFDDSIPVLMLDADQIKRALINLIENALYSVIKSGIVNPQISVITKHDAKKHMVYLEIADNGLGIQASDKSRIFDPYYTTKKEGTGIGLGIVLSIITDHNGTIRVFDNNPRGAKFVITLLTESKTQRILSDI
jgi:two-component system nitrogen regulation sensor histidine kinase NtrY